MKVGLDEGGQLDVFQRQRVACIDRNDDIVAALRCMSQNVREIVENALAELHDVLTPSACREILDNVMPEIRCEHESIVASMTHKQIVARSACQGVAAGRAQDRAARTCNHVASTIELLS